MTTEIVIPRVWKSTGQVIILFPTEPASVTSPYTCDSWMPDEGSGGANPQAVMRQTRMATPEEYTPVLEQMKQIYDEPVEFKVYSKFHRWLDEARMKSWQEMRNPPPQESAEMATYKAEHEFQVNDRVRVKEIRLEDLEGTSNPQGVVDWVRGQTGVVITADADRDARYTVKMDNPPSDPKLFVAILEALGAEEGEEGELILGLYDVEIERVPETAPATYKAQQQKAGPEARMDEVAKRIETLSTLLKNGLYAFNHWDSQDMSGARAYNSRVFLRSDGQGGQFQFQPIGGVNHTYVANQWAELVKAVDAALVDALHIQKNIFGNPSIQGDGLAGRYGMHPHLMRDLAKTLETLEKNLGETFKQGLKTIEQFLKRIPTADGFENYYLYGFGKPAVDTHMAALSQAIGRLKDQVAPYAEVEKRKEKLQQQTQPTYEEQTQQFQQQVRAPARTEAAPGSPRVTLAQATYKGMKLAQEYGDDTWQLKLWVDNDEEMYGLKDAWYENLLKKIKAGKFDDEKGKLGITKYYWMEGARKARKAGCEVKNNNVDWPELYADFMDDFREWLEYQQHTDDVEVRKFLGVGEPEVATYKAFDLMDGAYLAAVGLMAKSLWDFYRAYRKYQKDMRKHRRSPQTPDAPDRLTPQEIQKTTQSVMGRILQSPSWKQMQEGLYPEFDAILYEQENGRYQVREAFQHFIQKVHADVVDQAAKNGVVAEYVMDERAMEQMLVDDYQAWSRQKDDPENPDRLHRSSKDDRRPLRLAATMDLDLPERATLQELARLLEHKYVATFADRDTIRGARYGWLPLGDAVDRYEGFVVLSDPIQATPMAVYGGPAKEAIDRYKTPLDRLWIDPKYYNREPYPHPYPPKRLKRSEATKRPFTPEEAEALGKKLGVDWHKIDPEQFRRGLEVEWEHAGTVGEDLITVAKIVLDHLKEFPDYYTRLAKVEKTASDDEPLIGKWAVDVLGRLFINAYTLEEIPVDPPVHAAWLGEDHGTYYMTGDVFQTYENNTVSTVLYFNPKPEDVGALTPQLKEAIRQAFRAPAFASVKPLKMYSLAPWRENRDAFAQLPESQREAAFLNMLRRVGLNPPYSQVRDGTGGTTPDAPANRRLNLYQQLDNQGASLPGDQDPREWVQRIARKKVTEHTNKNSQIIGTHLFPGTRQYGRIRLSEQASGRRIEVSIPDRTLKAYDESGQEVADAVISWGKSTPRGTFAVTGKLRSTPTNIPGKPWDLPYVLCFHTAWTETPTAVYAIHGIPKDHGTDVPQPLGYPNSEGCVRVDDDTARFLFDWAEEGTPVVIH